MRRDLRRTMGALVALAAIHGSCMAAASQEQETYSNPLKLRLADGALAENCADPAVIRERGGAGSAWYLFCTTDPIDRRERTDEGWKFHMMPVYRSTDLVDWRYVGDAFSTLPALAAPKAGLWAPEPQYINGRYYLYFAITDVVDAASPEPGCDKDSGIAVATSASPSGPWEVADKLVVAPRRAGPGCEFHWTIDPDVVLDGGRPYLYYGSYGGGMFVQPLSEDGLTGVGAPVRVGAAGRYEGAEVVRHGNWWYLFGSATNCCNGPLTGYALFVGRARGPEGPFLDRQGNDMAAVRAGGTPVLAQNGNRWVGPGHNTVFEDDSGQWWTMYHAVDEKQPFFSAQDRLTRRMALLERMEWVDGWPVIGAGTGPSDGPFPLPGKKAKPPGAPEAARQAKVLWSDEFRQKRLAPRWSWVRPAIAQGWSSGAGLSMPTQTADLHHDTDNAGLLTAALPGRGDYRVELRLQLDAPDDCCVQPVQAGMVLYRDDNNYVKLVELAHHGLRQVEFAKEMFPVQADYPRYGNTVVGPPGPWTWLRLDIERGHGNNQDQERYTAYSSQNGRDWVKGGSWMHQLGQDARLGLVSMGGSGWTAKFARVSVSRLPQKTR